MSARPPLTRLNTRTPPTADNGAASEATVVGYTICSRVQQEGPHRFLATAHAVPYNVELRCAPEERWIVCDSKEGARRARAKLAEALAHDVVARGNRIVQQVCRDECNEDGRPAPSAPARCVREAPRDCTNA